MVKKQLDRVYRKLKKLNLVHHMHYTSARDYATFYFPANSILWGDQVFDAYDTDLNIFEYMMKIPFEDLPLYLDFKTNLNNEALEIAAQEDPLIGSMSFKIQYRDSIKFATKIAQKRLEFGSKYKTLGYPLEI